MGEPHPDGSYPTTNRPADRSLPAETFYYGDVNPGVVVNETPTRTSLPSLAVAVVTAVARREGVDETELPPLRDAIDPDALDGVFAGSLDHPAKGPSRVGFEYCDYRVVVEEDRSVTLERLGRTSGVAGRPGSSTVAVVDVP